MGVAAYAYFLACNFYFLIFCCFSQFIFLYNSVHLLFKVYIKNQVRSWVSQALRLGSAYKDSHGSGHYPAHSWARMWGWLYWQVRSLQSRLAFEPSSESWLAAFGTAAQGASAVLSPSQSRFVLWGTALVIIKKKNRIKLCYYFVLCVETRFWALLIEF